MGSKSESPEETTGVVAEKLSPARRAILAAQKKAAEKGPPAKRQKKNPCYLQTYEIRNGQAVVMIMSSDPDDGNLYAFDAFAHWVFLPEKKRHYDPQFVNEIDFIQGLPICEMPQRDHWGTAKRTTKTGAYPCKLFLLHGGNLEKKLSLMAKKFSEVLKADIQIHEVVKGNSHDVGSYPKLSRFVTYFGIVEHLVHLFGETGQDGMKELPDGWAEKNKDILEEYVDLDEVDDRMARLVGLRLSKK